MGWFRLPQQVTTILPSSVKQLTLEIQEVHHALVKATVPLALLARVVSVYLLTLKIRPVVAVVELGGLVLMTVLAALR